MNIIFILIPLSILVGLIGVIAFFWAVKTGQFDDLDTPAHKVLLDDEEERSDKLK